MIGNRDERFARKDSTNLGKSWIGKKRNHRRKKVNKSIMELTPLEQRVLLSNAQLAYYDFEGASPNTSGWSSSTVASDSGTNQYLVGNSSPLTLLLTSLPNHKGLGLHARVYFFDDTGPVGTFAITESTAGTVATFDLSKLNLTGQTLNGTGVSNDYVFEFDLPIATAGSSSSITFSPSGMGVGAKYGMDLVSASLLAPQAPGTSGDGGPQGDATAMINMLSSDNFGRTLEPSLEWTNSNLSIAGSDGGNNIVGLPSLIQDGSNTVIAVDNGADARWFDTSNGTNFTMRFAGLDRMTYDSTNHEYDILSADGTITRYHDFTITPSGKRGKLKEIDDPGDNATSFNYDTSGKITSIERTSGSFTERFAYTYFASGSNAGKIEYITLEHDTGTATPIRTEAFTYYDGSGTGINAYGNLGDLQSVKLLSGGTNGATIDSEYFRYWVSGDTGFSTHGYSSALKMALGPASYARAVAAGDDPLSTSVSDTTLADFADLSYQYQPSTERVTSMVVQGTGCSSCARGMGTTTYTYSSNTNGASVGYDSWLNKVDAAEPDGSDVLNYTNAYGQSMLNATQDPTSHNIWGTFHHYNTDGLVDLTAHPSALSLPTNVATFEPNYDLLNKTSGNYQYMSDSSGLVETLSYATEDGVPGYPSDTSDQQGEDGTPVPQEHTSYAEHDDGDGNPIFVPSSQLQYVSTNTYTYTYTDTWQGTTRQLAGQQLAQPAVTSGQNGSNSSNNTKTYDDPYGRPIWTMDEDGFVTFTAYDLESGAVTKRIVDVDYSSLTTDEKTSFDDTGWSQPSGGLHLVTSTVVDDLGRPTQITDPDGRITYMTYDDPNHESRTYIGWTSSGSGTNTVYFPSAPVEVQRTDRAGSYDELLTFKYTPGTNTTPLGTESITASNITSLTRTHYSDANQNDYTDVYFDLSGQSYSTSGTIGSAGTNYLRTTYGYQSRGLLKRTESPDGTIEWTVYDTMMRPVSKWVGTDDTSATNSDPTGGGATGNNMLKVASYTYDGGGVGDSNLTTSSMWFGSGGSDHYDTTMAYDFRDRLTDQRGPDNVATKYTLDNQGNATETQVYADSDQDFVIDSGELRGQSTAAFDTLGRVYQQTVYNVDPSTGSVGHSLTSNTWYNGRGLVAKVADANGLFRKYAYDGADRQTASYLGFDSDESTYSEALTTTGDTVIEQLKTIYDGAGNVVTTTSYSRLDNDNSSTGDLGAATNQAFIQVNVNWFDQADRLIATANYGRDNGATRYVFNSSGVLIDGDSDGIPDEAENSPRDVNQSYSDDMIVGKFTYGDDGRLFSTTDNLDRQNNTYYDLMGRTTKTVNNVQGTNVTVLETDLDKRQTTEFIYDSSGRLSIMRAENPKGSGNGIEDQDTTYLYESPISGSFATSVIYPDSADTTSSGTDQVKTVFDRLGRKTQVTDQNDTVHQYEYDSAGRFYADNVTTLGTNIDGAVLRIEDTYDDLGRVQHVISRSGTSSASTIVNDILYVYDGWGNVAASYQDHSGSATNTDPGVLYTYEDGAGTNTAALHIRLSEVTYPNGRVADYTYGSGGSIDDLLNRVVEITSTKSGTTNTLADYSYVGAGMIVKTTHPDVTGGLTLSFGTGGAYTGWDRFGRVIKQEWTHTSGTNTVTLDGYQYTYDRVGNIQTKDVTSSGAASTLDERYTYDDLNRLFEVRRGTLSSGLITSPSKLWDWTLDALGNWRDYKVTNSPHSGDTNLDGSVGFADLVNEGQTQGDPPPLHWYDGDLDGDGDVDSNDTNLVSASYGFSGGNAATDQSRTNNAANEITDITDGGSTWIDPVYDADGQMTSGPKPDSPTTKLHYAYDAWGRMVSVKADSGGSPGSTIATYAYDGLDRRITKTIGGHAYDGYYNEDWQLLEVRIDGDTDAREQYVYDQSYIDQPIIRYFDSNNDGDYADLNDNTLYYTTDANHNITSLVNPSGSEVEHYVYDPYGAVSVYDSGWVGIANSAVSNDVQFGGYKADAETSFNYARERYYNSSTGTWQERDHKLYMDGLNLNQYSRSNPIVFIDPFGEKILWSNGEVKRWHAYDAMEYDIHYSANKELLQQGMDSILAITKGTAGADVDGRTGFVLGPDAAGVLSGSQKSLTGLLNKYASVHETEVDINLDPYAAADKKIHEIVDKIVKEESQDKTKCKCNFIVYIGHTFTPSGEGDFGHGINFIPVSCFQQDSLEQAQYMGFKTPSLEAYPTSFAKDKLSTEGLVIQATKAMWVLSKEIAAKISFHECDHAEVYIIWGSTNVAGDGGGKSRALGGQPDTLIGYWNKTR